MSEKTESRFGHDHSMGREFPEVNDPSTDLIDTPERLQQPHALAVAASLDGLWEWDLRSDSLQYSDRCRELLGYGKNEIPHTMRFFWDSLHPEDTEAVQDVVRRHLEQEGSTPTDSEFRLRTKQGDYRWFRARGQARLDDTGRLILIAGVIQDITDRKQVEKTLEDRLRFEKLLADLSATFVNLPCEQIAGAIDGSLKMLVQSLGIDRSTLTEFPEDKRHVLVTHSYTVADHQPFPVGAIIDDQFPWYLSQLRLGRTIFLRRLPDDLPPEAIKEKQHCIAQGMKSNLAIPLRARGTVLGAITFAFLTRPCEWGQEIVSRLQMIGEVFANALLHKRSDEAIQAALAENEKLRDRLELENVYLREQVVLKHQHGRIICHSEALKKVLSKAERVAGTDTPILLLGETGTGKELVAQTIHELSARKERPLVIINCASLPAMLIEGELFGREAGAYTGAVSKQVGRFDIANGSTLFLDEIGELPCELQAKLLRVLEDGRFQRLGSPETITVDVRLIAATNRNLEQALRDGSFRSDLYHRLNVFPIHVPPLRDRREDIPPLVWAFVETLGRRMGKTIKSIPRKTLEQLEQYSWPGNVRELRNVIERALILTTGAVLEIEVPTFPQILTSPPATPTERSREQILRVLHETGWRIRGVGGAAEVLGVKPTTLESRMAKLGITRPKQGSKNP